MKIGLKDDKNEKNYEKDKFTENEIIKVRLSKGSSKTNKQKNSFSKSKSNPKKEKFIVTTDSPNDERNNSNPRYKRKSNNNNNSNSNNIKDNKIFGIIDFSNDNKGRKNNGDNQKVENKNYPLFISQNELSKLNINI